MKRIKNLKLITIVIIINMMCVLNVNGQWVQTKSFGHPETCSFFTYSDSVVYIANYNSVYKSYNNGLNWEKLSFLSNETGSIEALGNSIGIVVNYGTSTISHSYLHFSHDYGQNWQNINSQFPSNAGLGSLFKYYNKFYLSSFNGIYQSLDSGYTWSKIPNLDSVINIVYVNGNTLYSLVENKSLYKTNNNGLTWTNIKYGIPDSADITSIVAIDSFLYVSTLFDGIYFSNNQGLTWEKKIYGILPQSHFISNFKIHNNNIYIQDSWNNIYKTIVGDTIWSLYTTINSGTLFFKDSLIFKLTKGNYISYNDGNTWIPINNGIERTTSTVNKLRKFGNDIYASTFEDGIFKSNDGGLNWTSLNNVFEDFNCVNDIEIIDSLIFIGTQDSGVFVTSDMGQTWSLRNNGLNHSFLYSLASKGSKLFAATINGIYVTNDYGQNWVQSSNFLIDSILFSIAVEGNKIFAKTYDGLFVSDNDGISWNLINSNCKGYTLAVEGNKIFAGDYFTGVFSEDNGLSWTQTNDTTAYYLDVKTSLIKSNILILGGYLYLHKANAGRYYARIILSTDKGQTWTDYSDFFYYSNSKINSILELNDTIYVAADGTIWKRPLSDFVGINEKTQNNQFSLFPNPATNSLTLNLSQLKNLQNTSVSIYDIQGKLLFQQKILQTQTQLNIANLARGIYIIKVNNDTYTITRKFVKE